MLFIVIVFVERRTEIVVVLAKIVELSVLEAATVAVVVWNVFGLYATTLVAFDDVALGLIGGEEDEDTFVVCSAVNVCLEAGTFA